MTGTEESGERMITVRDATPAERALIMRDSFLFTGPIPKHLHLTEQEVAELCGINWRAEVKAAAEYKPEFGHQPVCAFYGRKRA